MNLFKKNIYLLTGMLALFVALLSPSCKLEDLEDPNNPSAAAIENNATLPEIQNVVDGTLAGMRNNLPIYFDALGVIGREFWRFSGSDPRYTTDLLGGGDAELDPGGFYTTNPYGSRYRVVRNCYILEAAIDNSTAAMTDQQRNAARGFAKTIRAHEMLLAFNQQYENGIRTDVKDPFNLGPFQSKDGSLDAIAALLDEAKGNLDAGGETFPFTLPSDIFNIVENPGDPVTVREFKQFNRALAARVAAYRQQWDACLTALNESFMDVDPNGGLDLARGCYYIYSKTGGDLLNEMYQAPTATGEIRIVQPSFVSDAEAGDTRLSKAFKRADAPTQAGLTGEYGFNVYASNTSPIAIVRNEELVLLYAEAQAQKGNGTEAVKAIDIVRNAAGLANYGGATDKDALVSEMLKQRRYSLYGEGHRWVDMRRYGRLGELPIDRVDDNVWTSFPRPANEE